MKKCSSIKETSPCLTGIKSPRNPKFLPPLENTEPSRRSATMPACKLVKIVPSEVPLQPFENKELNLKPLILPLKKSASARTIKHFSTTLKTRCKNINLSSKKIPQNDYLTFMLEKIPTFDFMRELNLLKKKDRILKEIITIAEEDQEHYCLE